MIGEGGPPLPEGRQYRQEWLDETERFSEAITRFLQTRFGTNEEGILGPGFNDKDGAHISGGDSRSLAYRREGINPSFVRVYYDGDTIEQIHFRLGDSTDDYYLKGASLAEVLDYLNQ